MDDDALLAGVMRKLFGQCGSPDGAYIDVGEATCIDGWVNGLTPDEVAALERLYEATRDG